MSAVYLAGKFLQLYNGGDALPGLGATALIHELSLSKQYSPEDVRNCASCFEQLATLIQTSALQVIVQKFKSSRYYEVSRIVSQALKIKRKQHNS